MSDDERPDDEAAPPGFGDEPLSRSDMSLLKQALRADWPINPSSRNWILRRVGQVLEKDKKPRNQLAAAKLLLAATSLNIKQQALDLAREKFEADRDGSDGPTVVDVVKEMQAAAARYEREHPDEEPGDRGGTGEVPDGPGEVQ